MRMADKRICSLKSAELSVEVLPAEGGRISSLKSMESGVEFLTQSHRIGTYPKARLDARFQDGACAGIEECLPTVGPAGPDTEGGPAPDHGDFWQLPWKVLSASDKHASLAAVGFSRPLRFSKKLTLDSNVLRVAYTVVNSGSTAQSFLYACHPLFAVAAGDRVLLPAEVRKLRLDYSKAERLGKSGSVLSWPITELAIRLDVVQGPEAGTAEMFYTSRLDEGICGIFRESSNQLLEVSFDTRQLPYLGLWLCYGGWPNEGDQPLQYAVALEPTTSPCNTLGDAQRTRTSISLNAGETYCWEIVFRASERRAR
jgi:galactose mutarotase-like enzyme